MKFSVSRLAPLFVLCGLTAASQAQTQTAAADPPGPALVRPDDPGAGFWRLMMSPATYHYHYDAGHRHVYMLGAERQYPGGFVWGGTWFRNSFGQPSAYAYAGRRFDHVGAVEPLFVQLTAGVLYGYKAPYEDKVPLNRNGWSPGAVASVGWQFAQRYSAQLNLLGNSALMLQFSADLR